MAEIGKTIGEHRLQDFIPVKEAASELKLNTATIKRWLKQKNIKNIKELKEVTWGRDRRGWVFIHRDSVKFLKQYRDSIKLN